jgi:hypothetical protein
MGPKFLGSRIAELPADQRLPTGVTYRRAKVLLALGAAVVIVPFFLLVTLTADPGMPSESHVIPLELYYASVAIGAVCFAAGITLVVRVRRVLDRRREPERPPR